jgi:hypothetical protein
MVKLVEKKIFRLFVIILENIYSEKKKSDLWSKADITFPI